MVKRIMNCLLLIVLCASLLFFPATALADLGEMDYQPGEFVVTITDEHQAIYEQLLTEASEGAQKSEGFWKFHRMDQLDERLRDDAEYYSSDAYDHVNYPLPYTFFVPSENDIDAETALFIAYDYLMQDKNFSYDRLLHFYPRFLFVSTETTGTLWWVQFYCFDKTYIDTYRVLIYALDGSVAQFYKNITVG